jgi:hypothetical protein
MAELQPQFGHREAKVIPVIAAQRMPQITLATMTHLQEHHQRAIGMEEKQ